MSKQAIIRFQLGGWIIFIFSALFFIAASWRAGDPLGLAGGMLFLAACFVFVAPLLARQSAAFNNLLRRGKYFRYRPGWSRAANCLSRVPVAPMTQLALEHHQDQNRRLQARSALRFFASTR